MEEKLLDIEYRQALIAQITNSTENQDRKDQSEADYDVYSGNIEPYVLKKLNKSFSPDTVSSFPLVSTINIAEKVVNSQASIYTNAPERKFHGVEDRGREALGEVYKDMWIDSKMLTANRFFKLQKQTHVMVIPKNGKLQARVIKNHQLDVVPNPKDPEKGEIYILSGYDKIRSRAKAQQSDGQNQTIADQDDYKTTLARHVVWSKSFHFVMNGKGDIVSDLDDIANPIGMIPIVEISEEKDMVYFLEWMNNDTKFTVEYNEALSNQSLVVLMQGFSQAVMKAPKDLMPQSLTVGPTKILKLITDDNEPDSVKFDFVSTGADLGGVQAHTQSLLAQYLSSKGLDANAITGQATSSNFSSGVERLLALVEKFEASREDISRFEQAEMMIFEVIKAWMNELNNTDLLEDKYKSVIPENATMSIEYAKPEEMISQAEQLDIIERKMDLGLIGKKEAVMELNNMDEEQATEYLNGLEETEVQQERSIPEIQP